MYGKIKRNINKIFNKLGIVSNSLQDFIYNTPNVFSNKNITTFSLKITLVILSTLIILFILPNFSNAYSLNDSLDNLKTLTFKPLSDLSNDIAYNNSYIDSSVNEDYNKFYCVISKNNVNYLLYVFWYKNNGVYDYDYGLLDSSYNSYFNNTGFAFGDTTSTCKANCRIFPLDNYSYDIFNKERATISNMACTNFYDSSFDFTIVNNTIYTDLSNFYVFSNGTKYDLLEVTQEDPQEPTEENEESTSVDLSFTNNLLFYLCFIMTLNTFYTMIRNVFHKEW